MYRTLLLSCLALLASCREQSGLDPYLGSYYGGFDTAETADPYDDLNPNECPDPADREACRGAHGNPLSHLLLRLGRNDAGELTLAFYRSESDYREGRPMYLSNACRTGVGPATDYRLHRVDETRDETQVLATARFPLVFGNTIPDCTRSARFGSSESPSLDLSLQANPVTGASAVTLTLERSRRDGNYLYVKQDGEKIPVKLDLSYVGSDGDEARRLCAADGETKLENRDGDEAICVMTGRKQWRVILPLSPWGPGITAFWGSTRSPEWYRSSDEPDVVTYHRALFVPVSLDPEGPARAE